MTTSALAYAQSHREQFLSELFDYLKIPSVSAQPAHNADTQRTAEWLSANFTKIGLTARVMPTGGHPVVYAEWLGAKGKPTVLIYGHYDVQPAEPFELWHSEPFTPTVRDGYIYARGSCDDKGQHFAHVKACESYLRAQGELPVNVKFIIEGEEEIGSVHLSEFIAANKDLLACDAIMISDSALLSLTQPSLVGGLRGLTGFEMTVRALDHDLHSGSYGGNVENANMALAQILAKLKDDTGHVLAPGFYDGVRVLSADERADLARVPFGERELLAETGAKMPLGEREFTINERRGARPTLEVNGMWGGYTGPGGKTVIPALAHAKITCRLVPYQDPKQVYEAVTSFIQKIAPKTVEVTFDKPRDGYGARAALVDRDTAPVQAAMRAAEATYGNKPVFELEGGSIPVVNDFQDVLRKPVVLLGLGLADDNLHAPNERFAIACYEKGVDVAIRFLQEMA